MNVSVFAQATAAKLAAYAPIKELLRDLIVNRGATAFYIGDKGYFYMHVVSALEELKAGISADSLLRGYDKRI